MTDNLSDVFAQARRYGLVDLCTLDGGTYSCSILIEHEQREMKAKSGYGHQTPASAITAAMEAAEGMADVKNPSIAGKAVKAHGLGRFRLLRTGSCSAPARSPPGRPI